MKQYILIAGVDYEQMLSSNIGTNFKIYCINRMKRIVQGASNNEQLYFYIFDFKSGILETYYYVGKKLSKRENAEIYKPILKQYFEKRPGNEEPSLKKNLPDRIMSIIDIYSAIQQIGKNDPKTLYEVSFFSHAYWSGPILVNSYDDTERSPLRDPNDRDPRKSKDFEELNMSTENKDLMKKAFNDNGYLWIWGCNDHQPLRSLITKIQKNPMYKEQGLDDNVIFTLRNLTRDEVIWLEKALNKEFKNLGNVQVKFSEVKTTFCKILSSIYHTTFAKAVNKKVFGGLVGTYSTDENVAKPPNQRVANPLMMIIPELKKIIAFYQNYLSIELDPENLNYGAYKSDFNCVNIPA